MLEADAAWEADAARANLAKDGRDASAAMPPLDAAGTFDPLPPQSP
jgi:hypothetical protein